MMAFLIAAIFALGPFVLLIFADTIDDRRRRRRIRSTDVVKRPDPSGNTLTAGDTAGCQVEGRLVRRLMAGRIDRTVYRRAMAELAVHDARSRPLHVPGDAPG